MDGKKRCVSEGMKVGQLMDIVIQFLEKNPQVRHFTAASLVAASLAAFSMPVRGMAEKHVRFPPNTVEIVTEISALGGPPMLLIGVE